MKHIHLDLVRVTEAAAIEASHHVGRGDKMAADKAATDAMRDRLNRIEFAAKIAIGEGEKDGAPGLFKGECVGMNWVPCFTDKPREPILGLYDIAVDPLDGTTQTSRGGNEAMSVIAVANQGCLLDTGSWYMHKLAVGPVVARSGINLFMPIRERVEMIAGALKKDVSKVTVCVLDRPRHTNLINELREAGCCIKLIQDCDITAAIATAIPTSGIDAYMGIGGSPEGVIGAAALKCMGGDFFGMLCDKNGVPPDVVQLGMEDLAKGDVIFCATGVTDGSLLKGVRWTTNGPETQTVTMRSESGTVRWISTVHGN
jgi:fructose-1,6-bisphosphatase class II